MKTDAGYIPLDAVHPLRGLDSSAPPTQLDASFSPSITNMILRDGEAFKRPGYAEFTSETLLGDVLALVDFQALDGTRTFVALTSLRQYKYNEGASDWEDITASEQQHDILDVDTGSNWFKVRGNQTAVFTVSSEFTVSDSTGDNGAKVVTAVSYDSASDRTEITIASVTDSTVDGLITGVRYPVDDVDITSDWFEVVGDQTSVFADGDSFAVFGSTGNDGIYTVDGNPTTGGGNTRISVVEDVTHATANGDINKLYPLTTTSGDYIDWTVGTDDEYHRLYMTNGRDRPRYWDGDTARFMIWHPEYPSFVTCKSLEVYFSHMVLGNVTTTAGEPKLVAWSDTSDFDEFLAGNAGVLLISSISGGIQRLAILGDRLIIYADDTIASLSFIGGTAVMAAEELLQDVRLVSGRGIASLDSAHIYASQENLYFFDGSRGIRGVGDRIRKLYKRDIELEYAEDLFAFNDKAKRMIWVAVPTSQTTMAVYSLDYDIFNLQAFKWTRLEFADWFDCLGFYTRREGITWNGLSGTWDDWFGTWDNEGARVDFPVRVMGSGSNVYLMDETIATDDDTAVTASYESPDFTVPQEHLSVYGRWGEIEADLEGSEVSVYYSTNHGKAWTLAETKTLTSDFSRVTVPVDVLGQHFRVKFESTKYFSLRWFRVWVKPAGPD